MRNYEVQARWQPLYLCPALYEAAVKQYGVQPWFKKLEPLPSDKSVSTRQPSEKSLEAPKIIIDK